SLIRFPVLMLKSWTSLNALLSETCFHQQLLPLYPTCQIGDYIANSSSAVNAQKLPVDDALLFV
ncbi:MAG: hypothetical protein LIR10_01575, partial [Bacillota bacterium]|nr:hypothetical protein [Bacillota bacterium]